MENPLLGPFNKSYYYYLDTISNLLNLDSNIKRLSPTTNPVHIYNRIVLLLENLTIEERTDLFGFTKISSGRR
jgi:hypothetical protein